MFRQSNCPDREIAGGEDLAIDHVYVPQGQPFDLNIHPLIYLLSYLFIYQSILISSFISHPISLNLALYLSSYLYLCV